MKHELCQNLYKRFPTIFKYRDEKLGVDNKFLGIYCEDGWYKLIYELCEMLEKVDSDCYVRQVKEKFGTLHFYIVGNKNSHDVTFTYERKSENICEYCGRKGKLRNLTWTKTLCFFHYVEHRYLQIKYRIFWKFHSWPYAFKIKYKEIKKRLFNR